MPINSKYVFVASMDVDLDKEDLFNEVYDTEHIPNLVCSENLVRIDLLTESPHVGDDGRADNPVLEPGRVAL